MSKIIAFLGVAAALVLAAVVLPAFIRDRKASASSSCVNNLRQIDGAKAQWALENHKATNDVVSWNDIKPYLGREVVPQCSDGGAYTLGRVGASPRCSLAPAFVGGTYHELPK
ncbi:MAG: hypothetical protein NT154_44500 [Verrucomicrobia bacterium]|nr:hypothetical protein [Verrucomicrobiota bacterium]